MAAAGWRRRSVACVRVSVAAWASEGEMIRKEFYITIHAGCTIPIVTVRHMADTCRIRACKSTDRDGKAHDRGLTLISAWPRTTPPASTCASPSSRSARATITFWMSITAVPPSVVEPHQPIIATPSYEAALVQPLDGRRPSSSFTTGAGVRSHACIASTSARTSSRTRGRRSGPTTSSTLPRRCGRD
eukprot:6206648-Pleurochrysis_carterae.AAC.2